MATLPVKPTGSATLRPAMTVTLAATEALEHLYTFFPVRTKVVGQLFRALHFEGGHWQSSAVQAVLYLTVKTLRFVSLLP